MKLLRSALVLGLLMAGLSGCTYTGQAPEGPNAPTVVIYDIADRTAFGTANLVALPPTPDS
ncbi:hypothetical protein QFZ70_003687 [Arthrobacter sp. V1I9]|nr:hypothetical protein [Arthrobacter sp. V1I9]